MCTGVERNEGGVGEEKVKPTKRFPAGHDANQTTPNRTRENKNKKPKKNLTKNSTRRKKKFFFSLFVFPGKVQAPAEKSAGILPIFATNERECFLHVY